MINETKEQYNEPKNETDYDFATISKRSSMNIDILPSVRVIKPLSLFANQSAMNYKTKSQLGGELNSAPHLRDSK